jgi:hypothetical protein
MAPEAADITIMVFIEAIIRVTITTITEAGSLEVSTAGAKI